MNKVMGSNPPFYVGTKRPNYLGDFCSRRVLVDLYNILLAYYNRVSCDNVTAFSYIDLTISPRNCSSISFL